MEKNDIVHILEEIATLLELTGESPFKVRAYRSAARQLDSLSNDFSILVKEERLSEVPGIGKGLAEKITVLSRTGQLPLYDDLKKQVPESLLEMLAIPGLGAKKIKTMHKQLGIQSVADLKKACLEEIIAELPGFGTKTQNTILMGIEHLEKYRQRHLWWKAMKLASPILEKLQKLEGVEKADIAGSLRRRLETVRDLDFLAASSEPTRIMEWFTTQKWVATITAKGKTKSGVRLPEGMQADLRVVPKEQYASALLYFTGSKEHNIHLRERARQRGLTLNEYGLLPLKKGAPALFSKKKKMIEESDLFEALDLSYIPPELRENMGEIEAAEKKQLPSLINDKDIRGVFHNHTTASDGRNTLEEMASAAQELGWEYLGIADHSKSSVQANGLDETRVLRQIDQIKKLNRSNRYRIHLFTGIECDILNDGSLDLSDEVLKQLDYVVISIHRGFKQDEKTLTKRLIRAIEHPLSTMVGHLTGRLLLRREPYAINVHKVIDAAIANKTIIELNANPQRLDMDWRLWRHAKEKGLMCAINPDAHNTDSLLFYRAGVNIARKGWLEKKDILNTYSLAKVKSYFSH
ncbi:MAG: DNA polymerase/3'-5' exonuclease PolX [Waddliaceae bacterium]